MAKTKVLKLSKEQIEALERREATEAVEIKGGFHEMMDEASKNHVIKVNIASAAEEYACIFGANKNLYRVTPCTYDGLRPGKRRMLYTWWKQCGKPQDTKPETMKKLARRQKVNDVKSSTTNIHPHGDSAIYETIVNEGQPFRNNVLLINKKGNYGNINGEAAAADRYIEMGMTEYTVDCFFDHFEDYCVPMQETYNGMDVEPIFLPSKYPHILFNPQFSGIGYGLASNIPPFNVTEVLEAVIKLVKNPDAKIMLIPDFKFGCDIVDTGEFKKINKTGEGKLTVQGSYTIDPIANVIRITSLPLNVYAKPWIESIIPYCQKGGVLEGKIKDIRNNTDESNVNISLYLDSQSNPDDIIEFLLEKTTLRLTHAISLKTVEDYCIYEYGIKSLLENWIDYRRDTIRYMYNNKLVRAMEKQHTNEVMLMVFNGDNATDTIKICRESINRSDTITKLMKRYNITSLQAGAIADMKMYQFNKDTYARFKEEKKALKEENKRILSILESDSSVDEIIVQEMEEGIKKYGHPRHSRIIKLDGGEDESPDTMHLIGISKSGYIKKLKSKKGMTIGQVGKDNRNVTILEIGNRESILVISSDGTLSKIPISSIPDMKADDIGVEIKRYFTGSGDIVAVLRAPSEKASVAMKDTEFMMITRMGYAKRTPYGDFVLKNGKSQSLIKLNEGDVLSKVVMVSDPSHDVVICTSMGNGIRLPIKEINQISKAGKGSRVIALKPEEDVTDLCIINPSIKNLLYITSSGKMKITDLKYFSRMEKRNKPIQLITLDTTEQLIGVASVKKSDMIKLYGKKGGDDYDPIEVSSIPVRARISKGERVVKTIRGDFIVGFKIFRS